MELYIQVQLKHIEGCVEKRKVESEAGFETFVDITNDPVTEVFGDESNRSYCRGFSSTVTKKQTIQGKFGSSIAASAKANSFTPAGNEGVMDKIQEELSVLSKDVFSFMASQQNNANCQSRAKVPDIHYPVVQPGAAANTIPAEGEPQVRHVNRKRETVATGYVVTVLHGEICHGVSVNRDERKVWIEVVLDGHYHVHDAPQGPEKCFTLDDYVIGGFLIWPTNRLVLQL
ncbi:hypothetical protein C5167_025964, partial [Papaver somniferum]